MKRIVLKAIPDDATRLVALKRGEADIAYNIRGALAEDLRRTPGLTLKPVVGQVTNWAYFPYKGLVMTGSGAFGNAATRIEAFVAGGGTYAYGSYPDIDGLFREHAAEQDPKRREATLHRIQQLMHDKAMFAPIWLNAALIGVGPRVEESGAGLIAGYVFSAPYEDVKLKGK